MEEGISIDKEEINIDFISRVVLDDVRGYGNPGTRGEFLEGPSHLLSPEHGYLWSIYGIGTGDVLYCGGAVD